MSRYDIRKVQVFDYFFMVYKVDKGSCVEEMWIEQIEIKFQRLEFGCELLKGFQQKRFVLYLGKIILVRISYSKKIGKEEEIGWLVQWVGYNGILREKQ